ncbi:MAG: family 10 glycosylhydrolase, partial [Candidatus Marinimicrobia bacterium]|nr:family 10 glycosylhydrolase [Candidatus Neomarinimicrobiota bacterium]
PGYDPLAYAVEEAHKRGLELHAWFNTFATSSTIAGAPAAEHPDWVCRDGDGNPMGSSRCLSPGLKAVRDYTVAMVAEIVGNYDVDGIHFDYVRWNEYDNTEAGMIFAKQAEDMDLPDGVYPPGMEEYLERREAEASSLNKTAAPAGSIRYLFDIEHPESGGIPDSTDLFPDATPGVKFASWADWRRGATNVFIKAVHDTVQAIRPWVKVSPAALGRYKEASWNGYYSVFQDAARWFNEGWIDLLTPMSYHWLNGTTMYSQLLSDWNPNIGPGKAAGRPYSVGPASYLITNWSNHQGIVEQCRTLSWVKGFQFFSYGNWKDSTYPMESSHTVFARKTKQPSYHFMNAGVPAAPAAGWVKNSDSSYTLTVTPDAGVTDPQWFVIYRSKEASIDVDSAEIMELVFADSTFDLEVAFDGLQLNDDRYYYGVTMASRYWVESALSNVVSTDVLPSISPRVVNHVPATDAVNIPNNQVVVLEFNKSMDAASIAANVSVTPAPSGLTLSWEHPRWVKEDHLVLNIGASWQFNTEYTVTVGAATVDQAGLQIDGNGDGTGGDAFTLQFTVSGADEEAPILVQSVPADADIEVDTDSPVTLLFDELLDPASLSDVFTFYYDEFSVSPSYCIFKDSEDRTFVTVKPNSLMATNETVTLDFKAGISDTTGNAMEAGYISFTTDSTYYQTRRIIDAFTGTYAWERPGFSGSTSGIIDAASSTTLLSGNNYVPGFGTDRGSMRIIVVPETETWFARIYSAALNGVKNIDTSMTIQAYIFGDGSGYQFRIALAESNSASSNLFEVSQWYTVNWTGWKMIEWDLNDPEQFGEWGGTGGSLDGTAYSVNSLHLKGNPEDPLNTVTCYIDQLRSAERVEGLPAANLPPVIEAISDTFTVSAIAVYIDAVFSDPNPGDKLTFTVIPDTTAISLRYYSSPVGRVRLRPDETYTGVSKILFIVTDDGVGELSDTSVMNLTVSINPAVHEIPERFTVYPNYPNPFNPVTSLRFDLPQSDQVSIEIFNTRGQRVAVLANRYFEAGSYTLQFDAGFLSSGVYIYRVMAGDQIRVDRMTLMK